MRGPEKSQLPHLNGWMRPTSRYVESGLPVLRVARDAKTTVFILLKCPNTTAARRFFKRTVETNGIPYLSSIDKIGANLVGQESQNDILKLTGASRMIGIVQSKYLNNIAEKDHCVIKRIIRPTLVFKSFHSVAATLAGMKQLI